MTVNTDENIIDEFKVTSKSAKECVESTIGQSIVVRSEIERMVQEAEKYRGEDEATESKCEAENGLEKFSVAVCNTLME